MLDEKTPHIQPPSISTGRTDVSLVRRPEEEQDSALTLNEGKVLPVACVCPRLSSTLDGAHSPHHLPTCVFYEGLEGPRDTLIHLRSKWLNLSLQVSSTSLVSGHTIFFPYQARILKRRPPWGATEAEVADFSAKVIEELRQAFIRLEWTPSDEKLDGRSLLGVRYIFSIHYSPTHFSVPGRLLHRSSHGCRVIVPVSTASIPYGSWLPSRHLQWRHE
jgi:hypothetical protein